MRALVTWENGEKDTIEVCEEERSSFFEELFKNGMNCVVRTAPFRIINLRFAREIYLLNDQTELST